jgi:hypothetical protein
VLVKICPGSLLAVASASVSRPPEGQGGEAKVVRTSSNFSRLESDRAPEVPRDGHPLARPCYAPPVHPSPASPGRPPFRSHPAGHIRSASGSGTRRCLLRRRPPCVASKSKLSCPVGSRARALGSGSVGIPRWDSLDGLPDPQIDDPLVVTSSVRWRAARCRWCSSCGASSAAAT